MTQRYKKDTEIYKSETKRIADAADDRNNIIFKKWDDEFRKYKLIEQEKTRRLKIESDERKATEAQGYDIIAKEQTELLRSRDRNRKADEDRAAKERIESEKITQRRIEFEYKQGQDAIASIRRQENDKQQQEAKKAAENAARAANLAAKTNLIFDKTVTNMLAALKLTVVGPAKLVGSAIRFGIIQPLSALKGIIQGIIRDSLSGVSGIVGAALSPIGGTIKNVLYGATIGLGIGIGQRIGQDIVNGVVSSLPALNNAVLNGTRQGFNAIGASVKESANVDKALITARALAPGGNDPQKISELNNAITRVATDENLVVTTGELADIVLQQAKAGRSIQQITDSLESVARLITINAGTGESGDATKISGDFLTSTAKFQLQAKQQVEALGLLQGAATSAKVELADLAQSLRYYARSENNFEGFKEATQLTALAAAGGQTGSTAGVGLNEIFSPKRIGALGDFLNVDVADKNGRIKEKVQLLKELIEAYKTAIANGNKLEIDQDINQIVGERGGRTLNALSGLIGTGEDGSFNASKYDQVIKTVVGGTETLNKLFSAYEDRIGKGFTAYENIIEASQQLVGRTFAPAVDGILLKISNIIQDVFTPEALRPLTIMLERFRAILDSKAGNDFIYGLKVVLKDLLGSGVKQLTGFINLINNVLVSPKKSGQLIQDLKDAAQVIKLTGSFIKNVIITELKLGYQLMKGIIALSQNDGFKKGVLNIGEKFKSFLNNFVGLLKAIGGFVGKIYDAIAEVFQMGTQLASNFAVANGITFGSVAEDIRGIGSAIGDQLVQSGRNLKIVYGGVEDFLSGLQLKDLIFNLSEKLNLKLNSEDLGQWQKFSLTLAGVAGSILLFGANPITVFGGIAALLAQIPTDALNAFAANAKSWGESVRVGFLVLATDLGLTVDKLSELSGKFVGFIKTLADGIRDVFASEGFKNFLINYRNELTFMNYSMRQNIDIARRFYAEQVFNDKNRELARERFKKAGQQFSSGAAEFDNESRTQFPKDIKAVETNFNTPGVLGAATQLLTNTDTFRSLKTTLSEIKGLAVELLLPLVAVVEPVIRIGDILLQIIVPTVNVLLIAIRQIINAINFFLLPSIEFLNQGLIAIQLVLGGLMPSITLGIENASQQLTIMTNVITGITNNMVTDIRTIFQVFLPAVISNFAIGTRTHFFNIKSDCIRAFTEVYTQIANYLLQGQITIGNFFYGIRVRLYEMSVAFSNARARIIYDWTLLMSSIKLGIDNLKIFWSNIVNYMKYQFSVLVFNIKKMFLYDIPLAVQGGLKVLRDTFTTFINAVKANISSFLGLLTRIKNAVSLVFTAPYAALERLYNLAIKLVSPFSAIATALKDSANAVNGAGAGIKNAAGSISDRFANAGNAARNFVTGQNRSSTARRSTSGSTRLSSAANAYGPQFVAVSSGAAGLSEMQSAVAQGVAESIKPFFQTISSGGGLEQYLNNDKVLRFLNVIRRGEGTEGDKGYRTMFGGGQFSSFSRHPDRVITANGYSSSAAGAYQYLTTTWNSIAEQYGLTDFSPRNQDLGAIALLKQSGALDEILNNRITEAIIKAAPTWASLPGRNGNSVYGQPVRSFSELLSVYRNGPTSRGGGGLASAAGGSRSMIAQTRVGTLAAQEYGASRGGGRQHAGIDFDYGQNDPIYSLLSGVVTGGGYDPSGYGRYIDIYNAGQGVVLRVAEADSYSVKKGDTVSAGQAIGSGTTMTGVVHYEVRTDVDSKGIAGFGKSGTVDPINYLTKIGNISRSGSSVQIFGGGGSAGVDIPSIRLDTSELDAALSKSNSSFDALLKSIGGGLSSGGLPTIGNPRPFNIEELNISAAGGLNADGTPDTSRASEQYKATTDKIQEALKAYAENGLTSDEISEIKSLGGTVIVDGDKFKVELINPELVAAIAEQGGIAKLEEIIPSLGESATNDIVASVTADIPELVKTLKKAYEARGLSVDTQTLLSINENIEEEKKILETLPSSLSPEVIGALQKSGMLAVGAVDYGSEFIQPGSGGGGYTSYESSLNSLQRMGLMADAGSYGSRGPLGNTLSDTSSIAQLQASAAKQASLSTAKITVDLSGLGTHKTYTAQDVAAAVNDVVNSEAVEREMFNRFIHRLANDPQARAMVGF
jgi:muramidase (phage lysozyme)